MESVRHFAQGWLWPSINGSSYYYNQSEASGVSLLLKSSRPVDHLCVEGGLPAPSGLPLELVWGYLDIRKQPHPRPDTQESH